jgi:hypothetical protein
VKEEAEDTITSSNAKEEIIVWRRFITVELNTQIRHITLTLRKNMICFFVKFTGIITTSSCQTKTRKASIISVIMPVYLIMDMGESNIANQVLGILSPQIQKNMIFFVLGHT